MWIYWPIYVCYSCFKTYVLCAQSLLLYSTFNYHKICRFIYEWVISELQWYTSEETVHMLWKLNVCSNRESTLICPHFYRRREDYEVKNTRIVLQTVFTDILLISPSFKVIWTPPEVTACNRTNYEVILSVVCWDEKSHLEKFDSTSLSPNFFNFGYQILIIIVIVITINC
jgi:hypothetical protein